MNHIADSEIEAGTRTYDPGWVKVEFFAKTHDGEIVGDVDLLEMGTNLAKVFGFKKIAQLSVSRSDTGPIAG